MMNNYEVCITFVVSVEAMNEHEATVRVRNGFEYGKVDMSDVIETAVKLVEFNEE